MQHSATVSTRFPCIGTLQIVVYICGNKPHFGHRYEPPCAPKFPFLWYFRALPLPTFVDFFCVPLFWIKVKRREKIFIYLHLVSPGSLFLPIRSPPVAHKPRIRQIIEKNCTTFESAAVIWFKSSIFQSIEQMNDNGSTNAQMNQTIERKRHRSISVGVKSAAKAFFSFSDALGSRMGFADSSR